MREVVLHLPESTYERLVDAAAAVHKPLEQWIVDALTTDVGVSAYAAASCDMLAAALDARGFERLAPEKSRQLSTLLHSRKERSLSSAEAAALQTLMAEANALELASLEHLAATLGR